MGEVTLTVELAGEVTDLEARLERAREIAAERGIDIGSDLRSIEKRLGRIKGWLAVPEAAV